MAWSSISLPTDFSATPEEYVRQNIEKAIVRQHHYDPADALPEFPIKVGSARKRVDATIEAGLTASWGANVPKRSRKIDV